MKKFKSKFGYEVTAFIAVIYFTTVSFMYYNDEPLTAIFSISAIFILVFLTCIYISISTNYVITNNGTLKITCGIFYNKTFDITKVSSVSRSNNLMSSPAPSLDRLELTYGKMDVIIISPQDKIGFITELIKVNPNIENKVPQ